MIPAVPIATLDGYPLLASSPVRWRLATGVLPVEETFDMIPSDAAALLANSSGRTVTLKMIGGGSTIEVKGLYVKQAAPGDNPYISRVTVADRRWLWPSPHILRRYNIRRRVGVKRIVTQDQAALDVSAPDLLFAPYSTKTEQGSANDRWEPKDCVLDVLAEISDAEKEFYGSAFPPPVIVGAPFNDSQLVDSLTVDESGEAAIDRVLRAFPEVALYVNLEGAVVFFSRAAGGEQAMVAALGAEYVGRGHITTISNRAIRPKEIHVLFTRELEVRFDFEEHSSGGTVAQGSDDARFADNVLAVPDRFLQIGTRKVPQGTWITFAEALAAWGQPPLIAVGSQLTYRFILQALVPWNDLWGPLGILGSLDPNAEWSGRIRALQSHFRQTYRINRRWMDRILSLKAYSIGTVDQATGQRGPARAYGDHCYVAAKKHMFKQLGEVRQLGAGNSAGDLTLCTNIDGYPASGIIDANTKPSPAEVSVVDEDQGIIRLDYVVDPLGMMEVCLPSKMGNVPKADIRNRTNPITFDSIVKGGRLAALETDHKVAMILTAIPASPNNDQQLHRLIVKPADVRQLLGPAASTGLMDANGPIMEVRIGPGVETARIPWHDSRAKMVERAFGIEDGPVDFAGAVMNESSATGGAASLNSIALAEAATIYASYCDRSEGAATGQPNASIVPAGWLAEVVHEIDTAGVVGTTIRLPERIPKLTIWQFLDKSTRAILAKAIA